MVTIIRRSSQQEEARPSPTIQRVERNIEVKFSEPAPAKVPHTPIASRLVLVNEVWNDFNKELLERKKLSNQILPLLNRDGSQEELRELHTKIKSYQPVLEQLFKRARHVEQYGALPVERADASEVEAKSASLDSMKLKRKALIDERCKTKKKLEAPGIAKESKILEWQLKLDQANAEYALIDEQIKKLEGKA